MRILVVTYFYHPESHPRAIRWRALTRYWAGHGIAVDVLTVGGEKPEHVANLTVTQIGWSLRNAILKNITVRRLPNPSRIKFLLARAAGWIHRHTWKVLYWPDYAVFWSILASIRTRKMLKRHAYNSVISVSWPFSVNFAALLNRRFIPAGCWIADIGDPFAFADQGLNNVRLYASANRWFERRVIELADRIFTPTDAMTKFYREMYPTFKDKIGLAPHLTRLVPVRQQERVLRPLRERIQAVFTGNLSLRYIDPKFCLGVLTRYNEVFPECQIVLKLWGHVPPEIEDDIQHKAGHSHVVLMGSFQHGRIEEILTDADLFISIGGPSKLAVPSKIPDYLALGKPIIHFAADNSDPTRYYLAGIEHAIVIDPGDAFAPETLNRIWDLVQSPLSSENLESIARRIDENCSVAAVASVFTNGFSVGRQSI